MYECTNKSRDCNKKFVLVILFFK